MLYYIVRIVLYLCKYIGSLIYDYMTLSTMYGTQTPWNVPHPLWMHSFRVSGYVPIKGMQVRAIG